MLNSPLSVKIPGNANTLLGYFDRISEAANPTVGDLLFAGQRQRTRMLGRTARGVDSNETAFAPYSTNGPFYYYPNKGASERSRKSSAGALARKLGVQGKGNTAYINGTAKRHSATRTRLGIKFSSYAAFKQFLGRGGIVDLRGAKAPHMLQAILVKVAGVALRVNDRGGLDDTTPATEITIGIYGDEAKRAEGHNTGAGNLPKRHFFGANSNDPKLMNMDIVDRIAARMRAALKGVAK